MFRDILVVLGAKQTAAASFALSFAHRFGADVTAIWDGIEPADEDIALAETRYDLIISDRTEARERAAQGLSDLRVQAIKSAVTTHLVAPDDLTSAEARNLHQFARSFDLVILEQSEPTQASGRRTIEKILSGSGRPVLVIPYIQRDPASFNRITVAWDASPSAARALGDAMPILKRASAVEIVTVTDGGARQNLPSGAIVVRHLARHGVEAAFKEISGAGAAADMLLSHVADSGADLMVTGGYGHSRLRESVLGGVTRSLLDSMTIPVFMSH